MILENNRALATIQKIIKIESIENADRIELATVLGWQVVVKKDEFKINDLCIYIEIDSIVPDIPYFEFMRERKFRVRTIKLRKQISQGLIVKIEDLLDKNKKWKEGEDVTNILNIKKYDPEKEIEEKQIKNRKIKNPILRFLYRFKIVRLFLLPNKNRFPFPSHIIPKTDEERIQNIPQILKQIKNTRLYVTEKLDGQSATYILYKNKFMVCSRNMNLPKDNSNWWKIAEQFNIKEKLKSLQKEYKREFAIQGEIIGNGIQDNKYNLKGLDFYIFNIFDIKTKKYLSFYDFLHICKIINLKMVPLLNDYFIIDSREIKDLVEMAKGKSKIYDTLREGVVIRNVDMFSNKISFKVINPDFLIKYNL